MKVRASTPSDGRTEVTPPKALLQYLLKDDGAIPNNSKLPLLIYQEAVRPAQEQDPATAFEELFATQHWTGSWRNGIYTYHHYHSTAHEVLGVFSGSATVQFGGESGVIERINAGDVVLIPAGVGHKNLESSFDFGVVGAYPDGQEWDLCYGKTGERPLADYNIDCLQVPELDPVYGIDGPMRRFWHK